MHLASSIGWNYTRPLHPWRASLGDVARAFSITIWALERVASWSAFSFSASDAPSSASAGDACSKNVVSIWRRKKGRKEGRKEHSVFKAYLLLSTPLSQRLTLTASV